MASSVSIAEAKARFTELARRAEITKEPIIVTRRGKPVVAISPLSQEEKKGNIATELHGLLADHPEVCDEIDKIYAERRLHKARYAEF